MLPRSIILGIVGAALAAILIVLLVTARFILLPSYAELEEREARANVERVLNALSEESGRITSLALDYAAWDDSYRFAVDGNPEFVRRNLSSQNFENLGMNVIAYVNADGKMIFARAYDLEKKRFIVLPSGLRRIFAKGSRLLEHPGLKSIHEGIVSYGEGIAIIASVPIQTSDYLGPIRGSLIMGRFLDDAEMRRFSTITRLSLWVYATGDLGLPVSLGELLKRESLLLTKEDNRTISGYTVKNDVFGKPAAVVRVDTPRTTYRQGMKTIAYFVAWFGGLCILIAVLGDYVLGKMRLVYRKSEESDRRYRLLFEHGLDAILIGTPDGLILEANPEAQRLLGRSREEIIAAGRDGLFDTGDPAFAQAMEELSRSGRFAGELALLRKDGARIPAEVFSFVFRDSFGLEKTSTVIHDISERKNAEREKAELETRLRQAQKMEAIGRLAGGIAHDFNNILCALIGFTSLLEMSVKTDDPARPYVDQILGAVDRATRLVNGLLAFGRKQVINVQVVDLNAILGKLEGILSRLIPEEIDLRVALADHPLNVLADPGQIDQVILNLVANARDAMPGGGLISIETGESLLPRRLHNLSGARPDISYAVIGVNDTGVGMDPSLRDRIFEPYFTTKEVGKGTGLGLSIVYGIVKQHNGFITVDTEPGKGTLFRIYLPLADGSLPTSAIPATSPGDYRGTETLLVVEDDPSVRSLSRTVLETYGYRVIEAMNGVEAVKKFKEHEEEIRLVIMDVVMPKMNGNQAFTEIRKMQPQAQVLFISGHTQDIIHEKGVVDGGCRFIKKPFKPLDLVKKVRALLDQE